MAVATLLGVALALTWGWDLPAAIVFGISLSVASTVVVLRVLEARGLLDSTMVELRWAGWWWKIWSSYWCWYSCPPY